MNRLTTQFFLGGINMSIDFKINDVIHHIAVKFTNAFLPAAKKPFNLKAVHQPVLDVHGIASKAEVYNISTSPKIIEEGLNAGMELMYYLAADGYKIKTPLFNLKLRFPGEYDGSETSLPSGTFPVPRFQASAAFRKYLQEKVKVEFDGLHTNEGLIAGAFDDATGIDGEVMTVGNILTIRGSGLKIEGDEEEKERVGLYFTGENGKSIKADVVAVNESRTLKVLVPAELEDGRAYSLSIETRSPVKSSGAFLKNIRIIRSNFALTARIQKKASNSKKSA